MLQEGDEGMFQGAVVRITKINDNGTINLQDAAFNPPGGKTRDWTNVSAGLFRQHDGPLTTLKEKSMAAAGDKGTYQGKAVVITKVNADGTLNLQSTPSAAGPQPPNQENFTSVAASDFHGS